MSSFTSIAMRRTLRSSSSMRAFNTARSFQTGRTLAAGKESALNHEGRAEEAEHHKQDQLKKQEEGKGHWKDELASDSESIIKADRGEIDASQDTIKKLQDETAKMLQQKK